MRPLLLAVLVLVAPGCFHRVPDVKPLPPERHAETDVLVKFYPAEKPEEGALFVCGFVEAEFQCVDYEAFMVVVNEARKTDASL